MTFSLHKGHIWPAIITTVLVLDVGIGIAMMRLAADDPHAAIEPDYYRKAVGWDSTLAQGHRNTALGWLVSASLSAVAPTKDALLRVQLRDSVGAPLRGATVTIEAMHVAHANDIVRGTLTANDSDYVAELAIRRSGLWEVRLGVDRGGERFTTTIRLDASATGVAAVVHNRPGDPTTPPRVPSAGDLPAP